ncbi:MAG: hypothetical protein KC413_25190 [Anaerolineales bacterium]|nr:hypothetical protein [Anaerolineales bacterium]
MTTAGRQKAADNPMPGFDLILKFDKDDPDSAEICAEGMVGQRPYTFLLDTGAATTSLVWDDYTRRHRERYGHYS